jgi:hypothetical protein
MSMAPSDYLESDHTGKPSSRSFTSDKDRRCARAQNDRPQCHRPSVVKTVTAQLTSELSLGPGLEVGQFKQKLPLETWPATGTL